ncbi:hypothetical protein [Pseudomonas sp. FP1740]|uniref:hypothetical protein n=1 Tax=Pseudomonas sp. FP1740 TaxID=2954078 RepID=UPI002732DECA|nr:hypothetical protein [Pseudomonas sp. FP1740]WLG43219.1 hypothetical protein PSH69_20470 [Pseudomonas sp. FP1740]
MYAIMANGSYRAIDEWMELMEGETLYEVVPQWVYDMVEANRIRTEQVSVENAWRADEVGFVTDQLIGMEDGDPSALPGTEVQWRSYRTLVRAWKEGTEYFPDSSHRPVRPR